MNLKSDVIIKLYNILNKLIEKHMSLLKLLKCYGIAVFMSYPISH